MCIKLLFYCTIGIARCGDLIEDISELPEVIKPATQSTIHLINLAKLCIA